MSLLQYMKLLKRWWWLIAATTVLLTALAVAAALISPRAYRANSRMMLETAIPQSLSAGEFESYTKTYQVFIQNKSFLQGAVEHFQLNEPPYELTWEGLKDRISVDTYGKVFELRVDMPDPELARDVANYIAQEACSKGDTLPQQQMLKGFEDIQQEKGNLRSQLAEAGKELTEFKKKALMDELSRERNALLARQEVLPSRLAEIKADIIGKEHRLENLKETMQKQERILELSRVLAEEPLFNQLAARQRKVPATEVAGLRMQVEELNPVRVQVEQDIAQTAARIEERRALHEALRQERKKNTQRLSELTAELAEKQLELDTLNRSYDLADSAFRHVSSRLHDISLEVAKGRLVLRVVDPAVAPHEPQISGKATVLIGLGAGLFLGAFLSFVAENVRLLNSEKSKAQDNASEDVS